VLNLLPPGRPYLIPITLLLAIITGAQCMGTTVVVVVASNGIILASDGKQQSQSLIGKTPNPQSAVKNYVMNSKVAVAVVGMGSLSIISGTKKLFDYDSIRFLERIKHCLPSNASVNTVAGIIKDKSQVTLDRLSPYVENGTLNKNNAPGGDIVDYIVVGFERNLPTVIKVSIEPDWERRKLTGPVFKTVHPSQDVPIDTDIRFYGTTEAINNAASPTSREHAVAARKYPGVIKGLEVRQKALTINTSVGVPIATDLIRLESEFDSENVGPPIHIAILSRTKPPVIRRLAK
jgi:hypothetical protein